MDSLTINMLDNLTQEMINNGMLTVEYLETAKKEADFKKQSIGRVLIDKDIVLYERILNFVGERLSIPYVKLEDYEIDKNIIELIPSTIAQRFKIVPMFKIDDVLTVAMADPMDIISVDFIRTIAKCNVDPVLSSEQSIMSTIDKLYGKEDAKKEILESPAIKVEKTITKSSQKEEYDKLPIIKTVNEYINRAVFEGASDIHFEPQKDFMLVRFRIDGFLYDRDKLPARFINPVISRVKVMSDMDISKKITPQNGRISLNIKNCDVNIRVSTFPTVYGENVVLRIFSRTARPLLELGLSTEDLNAFEKILKIPQGLVLVTGPEGSGRTTTICSAINVLNTGSKNIVTIENPVEYEIKGAVQSQINPHAAISFTKAMESALYQDPDIIYVSKIKDFETADIVARSALLGHLILSAFYADDAVVSIVRLVDIGIDPLLMSSVLNCSFAQRLVRKICPRCAKEYKPDENSLKKLGLSHQIKYYKGTGCDFCNGTGYSGRVGLFEVLVVSKNIRRLIAKQASEDEILKAAKDEGMKTLLEDGLMKVTEGITTVDEIMRVF